MGVVVEYTKKRHPRQEESSFQQHLVTVLEERLPKECVVFAIPNGGSRHPAEGARLKREGVLAGMPDLGIIYRGVTYFLELKSKDGVLNQNQRETMPRIQAAGARVEVVRTVGQALNACAEFGIPLQQADNYDLKRIFKIESNRRPTRNWGKEWMA